MMVGMRRRLVLAAGMLAVGVTPGTASADFQHTVLPGESLTSIAVADGLSVDQVAAANGMSPTTRLVAGTTVAIPPQGAPATATLVTSTPVTSTPVTTAPSTSGDFQHTVLPGESLTSVAAADGLTVSQLAAANGLSTTAQLITGTTLSIPPQGAPATATPVASDDSSAATSAAPISSAPTQHTVLPGESLTSVAAANGVTIDELAQANGLSPTSWLIIGKTLSIPSPGSTSTAATTTTTASSTSSPAGGSYVVQPGDTLTAIAARAGTSVSALAADNGLDPNGVLLSGSTIQLSASSSGVPSQAPAVGSSITGRMTWFGGPNDPGAQGAPASGLGWLSNGMSYYNEGSLGGQWSIHFPWGQTLPMRQIDIGPAPWTHNAFDLAYSALPSTPYNQSTWPNPTVTGTYEGP
jgi:LysM repeat protein